jgi:hypothetical protein
MVLSYKINQGEILHNSRKSVEKQQVGRLMKYRTYPEKCLTI